MEENTVIMAENSKPIVGKTTLLKRSLKWFLPAWVIIAFSVGLGLASFCLLFCAPSDVENFFSKLALIFLLAGAIYFPVISWVMVSIGNSKQRLWQTIALSILGYVAMISLSIGWAFISAPINEQIIDSIENRIAQSWEKVRQSVIATSDLQSKVKFNFKEAHLAKIDDKFTVLSVSGELSGLLPLRAVQNYENVTLITKVELNGNDIPLPKADPLTNFGAEYSIGVDEPRRLYGTGDSEEVDLEVILPTDQVQRFAVDGKYKFSVLAEIWSHSPFIWTYDSLWNSKLDFEVAKQEVFFKDKPRIVSYFFPLGTQTFASIDSQGKFVPLPFWFTDFNITTNPKMALCCEAPVLKMYTTPKVINLDEYIRTLPWKEEIKQKRVIGNSGRTYILLEANPTIASPYKTLLSGYNDGSSQVEVLELSMKDDVLEGLFNKYLEKYTRESRVLENE